MTELQTLNCFKDYEGADILDESQFTQAGLEVIFNEARAARDFIGNTKKIDLLNGMVVAEHFEAASTRTRISYEAGAKRLGAEVVVADNMQSSSRSKGEKIQHTALTYECLTANAIVARTKKMGDVALMAEAVRVPVHNAGDGSGKHPTQAALDIFTMLEDSKGDLRGKKLLLARDALHGRTAHSLAPLAAMYGMEVAVVSHPALRMPQETIDACGEYGVEVQQSDDLEGMLPETDYFYVMRLQKERFKGWKGRRLYEKANGLYIATTELLDKYGSKNIKLLHPLPADGELADELDQDPRVLYGTQMENGVFIRQGLLAATLGKSIVKHVADLRVTQSAEEQLSAAA